MSEKNPTTHAQHWLKKARESLDGGSLAQALKNLEHAISIEPNSLEVRQFHIEMLTEKVAQFDVSNKNHENALRDLVNAWKALIAIEESLTHRKAQLEALEKLAILEDSPMIWVEYREACEQFFAKHNDRVDNDYAEALKHYANAFSYGVLQAFQNQQAGKPYDTRTLEKISKIERGMAENDITQQSHIERLMTFVRAQQSDFEIIEDTDFYKTNKIKTNKKSRLLYESFSPLIEQLHFLDFELLLVGHDKRLEKANPQVFFISKNGATFATLSMQTISAQTWLDHILNKLWKKYRNNCEKYKIDVTMTTFFTNDIVLKSLNKNEQARHDAPQGYLVKCRNYDIKTQWQLHEQHVDELERRIDARRLNNLSKKDFLAQEKIYADRLLAYKKAHGFMTFSEYHRATNIESRLSYSLILHGLAERITECESREF